MKFSNSMFSILLVSLLTVRVGCSVGKRFSALWFKGEEWFCPHESKLPLVHFLTPQTPEMIICYKTPAFFFSALASSDAFSISRRAFLVDTTISCSSLVRKSWIPQAVDNKKEDAIQDVITICFSATATQEKRDVL